MESMKTTLRRGRNVWDRVNLPETEFLGRIDEMRKRMVKQDIDVLLVYGDAWIDYSDPCYITNYYPGMVGSIAVVPRSGEVALIFWGSARGIEYIRDITWIKEIQASPDVAIACIEYLQRAGLTPSTLGLAGFKELMPWWQFRSFKAAVSECRTVDARHIISDMRMVKSARESDQVRRAARVLTGALEALTRTGLEDMNELTLNAALEREARLAGAEDVRLLYSRPRETGWTLRPVEDRPLSPGDTMIIYLAVEFERYWAEMIRTFKIETSGLVEVRSEKLEGAYNRILGLLKPAKSIATFYREVEEECRKSVASIPEFGLGDGIGLSVTEPPAITPKGSGKLIEGICLTLRLAMKDAAAGTVKLGNTIYLSANGPQIFTRR